MATKKTKTTPDRYDPLGDLPADARFILWDPKDGEPRREDDGEYLTDGLLGRITADNVYLTAYPVYPDDRRPKNIEVHARIRGVQFNLSGSKGTYDVIRVR